MSKRSLSSHLSRKDPKDDEFDEAIVEFHHGSDRVAAIMGAAFVEGNLNKVIESWLDDESDKRALFHDEGAPFGTFKRKIVAGRAMGLFTAKVAEDMDIIRDVRNQFAHSLLRLDFENEHIARACEKITPYKFTLRDREVSATRLRFEKACWAISTLLLSRANHNFDVRLAALRARNKLMPASLQSGANNVLGNGPTVEGGVKD